MLFSEPSFLFIFLPAVLLLHTLAGRKLRNGLLLVASLVFYAWGEPAYVLILLASIALNAGAGVALARAARRGRSRWPLAVGVAGNLLLLGHYKYAGFAAATLGFDWEGPPLPIGISFFTFQAISYLVDVYRGHASARRNPIDVALYIAGPIVRWADIERQMRERRVTREGFADGVRRFSCGLAKKMLLANTLALSADRIFALPAADLGAALAWTGVLAYALQIYFDFSGYSDMAIGLGRMFGFEFKENFDYPYVSRSMREFWRRWHISLSTGFRDYLYLPLGGGRPSPARVAANLWIVFLLCGLWHGASWNFVFWGAWHGVFLALERVLGARPRSADAWVPADALRWVYTSLVVLLGWVPFRAASLGGAFDFWSAMFGFGAGAAPFESVVDVRLPLALAAGVLGATPLVRRCFWRWRNKAAAGQRLERCLWGTLELAGLVALLFACSALMAADSYNPFIYFQF
jgi:alginate O-acetyltransferase complex protein AlgI